jgi:hypothetical protein
MVKATRFIKRDRVTPGRADGGVVCTVTLPAIDEEIERRFQFWEDEQKLLRLRRFVRKQLARADTLLEESSVTVDASIRMKSGRLGRTRLGVWREGDSIEGFLDAVIQNWQELPKEEDWKSETVEIPNRGSRKKH